MQNVDEREPESDSPSEPEQNQVMLQLQALLEGPGLLTLETKQGLEADGCLEDLHPDRHRLVVHLPKPPPVGLEPNAPVKLYFAQGQARWMAQAYVHHARSRHLIVLTLPRILERSERRRFPRLRLPSSIDVQVQIRTTLYQGIHLQGRLVDLSVGGLLVRVERAHDGKSGQTLSLEGQLLEVDEELEQIVLEGLPGHPSFEADGRVVRIHERGLGLLLSLRFRNLPQNLRSVLEEIIQQWTQEERPDGGSLRPVPKNRQEALRLLKKRGRSILVLMPGGRERDALTRFFLREGYGKVLTADTLEELTGLLHGGTVHLVFIDQGLEAMQGLELTSLVGWARSSPDTFILLASEDNSGRFLTQARQAQADRILPKPYALDPTLALLVERCLGLSSNPNNKV